MSDKVTKIIMLTGIILVLVLVAIDLMTNGTKPLSVIIALISLVLGILAVRVMRQYKN